MIKNLVFLALMVLSSAAVAQSYVCFPTCSEIDSRMVSAAGDELSTLAVDSEFIITVPVSETEFEVGVFDGDQKSSPAGGLWDSGVVQELEFQLYADPNGNGTGMILEQVWLGSTMVDNAWVDMSLLTSAAAQAAPGADFSYRLVVSLADPTLKSWNNYKLRVAAPADLMLADIVAIVPAMNYPSELAITRPGYQAGDHLTVIETLPTTYDGSWEFEFQVPAGVSEIIIWDGDFDRGDHAVIWDNGGWVNPPVIGEANLDTDDPDTANTGVPAWASSTYAAPEGVAVGGSGTGLSATGVPADDHWNPIFKRSPSVRYEIVSPGGVVFTNDNPSGNREFEQFRIGTTNCNAGVDADYCVAAIQPGAYVFKIDGLDMSNLVVLRFEYGVTQRRLCP